MSLFYKGRKIVNANTLSVFLLIVLLSIILIQVGFSAGLGWVLNGKIISAATCLPIKNATIISAYNNNASNLSSSSGTYSLILGTGNWTVYVRANGYYTLSYNTPYITSGALQHSFALLPLNNTSSSCWINITNITGPSISTTPSNNVPPGSIPVLPKQNTTPVTSNQTSVKPTTSNNLNLIEIIVIIIIVIIIIAAFIIKRRGKNNEAESESNTNTSTHI
ncbi:MAG: hypothetical protein ACP5LH_01900 [Candidatus Micrarchaeia archaeon]